MKMKLITCIIEKGKAETIIDEALRRGAQAATYYEAKGRGVREKMGVSGMFIKEEKEIILIVAREADAGNIFDTLVTMGGLKEKGKGFAFIQSVENAVGFVD
jgi:nitrogen regulatory protein P-II 1